MFKVSYIFSYFPWLKCAEQEFSFLFLQKFWRPVLVSHKVELGILSNYSESFSAFQNKEAALERCSTKVAVRQNVVMKYNSSAPAVKSRKALHTTLRKTAFHKKNFSKKLTARSEQRYWKIHLDGYFWEQLIFDSILEWLLLKGSCEDIFVLKVLMVIHILHFLLWRHVKEERISMHFFEVNISAKKYKHTELALKFVQKQFFS